MKGHPLEIKDIEHLNPINDKIYGVYKNVINNEFTKKTPGFFEFAMNSFFYDIDIIEAQYISYVLPMLDKKITYFQILKQEKEKQKAEQLAKFKGN